MFFRVVQARDEHEIAAIAVWPQNMAQVTIKYYLPPCFEINKRTSGRTQSIPVRQAGLASFTISGIAASLALASLGYMWCNFVASKGSLSVW